MEIHKISCNKAQKLYKIETYTYRNIELLKLKKKKKMKHIGHLHMQNSEIRYVIITKLRCLFRKLLTYHEKHEFM